MLKEVKYAVYLLTIFFFIFFVIKFYLSEDNIKWSNKVIFQYQDTLDKKFISLPLLKDDTKDIIEYTNEIEDFNNKKQRKYWNLGKDDASFRFINDNKPTSITKVIILKCISYVVKSGMNLIGVNTPNKM